MGRQGCAAMTVSSAAFFAHSAAPTWAPAARRDGTKSRKNFKTAVFAAAAVAKAVEPVLIDWSQATPGSTTGTGYAYSLASAVACAEAVKCAVCWALMLATSNRQKDKVPDFRFERVKVYMLPAALLAVANQTLFVGITYLGALLNQIARKAVCVLATAVLAQAVLGMQLSENQRVSLVLLTLGFILLLPHVSSLHEIHPLAVLLSPGLLAALAGGVCSAAQVVDAEHADTLHTCSIFRLPLFVAIAHTHARAHTLSHTQTRTCGETAPGGLYRTAVLCKFVAIRLINLLIHDLRRASISKKHRRARSTTLSTYRRFCFPFSASWPTLEY